MRVNNKNIILLMWREGAGGAARARNNGRGGLGRVEYLCLKYWFSRLNKYLGWFRSFVEMNNLDFCTLCNCYMYSKGIYIFWNNIKGNTECNTIYWNIVIAATTFTNTYHHGVLFSYLQFLSSFRFIRNCSVYFKYCSYYVLKCNHPHVIELNKWCQ